MDDHIYLSVLLCTFNDEKFISQTIESILNQTYPYFEFVIINDGSTDSTSNIIYTYNDPRIVLFENEHKGLTQSLIYGISKCKYNWVARIDGDDFALPNRFEKQVKFINDNISLIGCGVYTIDENNNILNKVNNLRFNTDHKKLAYYLKICINPFAHSSVIINKTKLQQVGGYDINFETAQDFNLWCRLSIIGELIYIPDPCVIIRIRSNGITKLKNKSQIKNIILSAIQLRRGHYYIMNKEQYDKNMHMLESSFLAKYILRKQLKTNRISNLISLFVRNLYIILHKHEY